ncbi:hypothetical protein [Salinivibrio costicola]|nr:hypothetical protein [Salinivibrio costicola]
MTTPSKTAASPDVTPKTVMQRFSVAPMLDWTDFPAISALA